MRIRVRMRIRMRVRMRKYLAKERGKSISIQVIHYLEELSLCATGSTWQRDTR